MPVQADCAAAETFRRDSMRFKVCRDRPASLGVHRLRDDRRCGSGHPTRKYGVRQAGVRPLSSAYLRMDKYFDPTDYSVVVKHRAAPPNPWRWEIYRAGRTCPIDHSEVYFESMTEANRAGKAALQLMLSEAQS